MSSERARITLRMPRSLHLRLTQIAKARVVSLNDLIVEVTSRKAEAVLSAPEYNPAWTFGEPVR